MMAARGQLSSPANLPAPFWLAVITGANLDLYLHIAGKLDIA